MSVQVCLSAAYLKNYAIFVLSFVLCGQRSSLLWTPVLRPYSGPVRLRTTSTSKFCQIFTHMTLCSCGIWCGNVCLLVLLAITIHGVCQWQFLVCCHSENKQFTS